MPNPANTKACSATNGIDLQLRGLEFMQTTAKLRERIGRLAVRQQDLIEDFDLAEAVWELDDKLDAIQRRALTRLLCAATN
jgi:hypothetical protein